MRKQHKFGDECEHAENMQAVRSIAKQLVPDIVLFGMRLPDGNGLDLLPEFYAKHQTFIVMTAHGDISDSVNAMKQCAMDFPKKPIDLDELHISDKKAENNTLLTTIMMRGEISTGKDVAARLIHLS